MGYQTRFSHERLLRGLGFTASLGLTALGSLGLGACSGDRPTEIVAGMMTQLRVPDDIRAVGVVVQQGGRVEFCESYSVTDGTASLPATIGWLNEGRSGKGPVTVQVLGLRTEDSAFTTDCVTTRPESLGKQVRVIRRRRLSFVDDHITYLPLPLKDSCRDISDCNEDETCVGGKCVAMDIDATTLPDYKDSFVFGNTNTCFDGNLCMPKGKTLPVSLTDLNDCSFEVPVPEQAQIPGGELNVRMFYESFG
ncbi:MAG TPA: hypothetical protein VFQ61_17300, partial [Polyangiaceae bacterium]|nr:hypothetical protein [Polyangiaceae bacterium]